MCQAVPPGSSKIDSEPHVPAQEPAAGSPHGYIVELQTAFLTAGPDAEQAQTSRMQVVDQLCGAYRCIDPASLRLKGNQAAVCKADVVWAMTLTWIVTAATGCRRRML
jgi:hypothetical protein